MKKLILALVVVSAAAAPQVFDSTELTKYLEVCAIDSKYLTTEQKIQGAKLTEKLEIAISNPKVKLINPPKASVMKKCMENLMQEVEKNGN